MELANCFWVVLGVRVRVDGPGQETIAKKERKQLAPGEQHRLESKSAI